MLSTCCPPYLSNFDFYNSVLLFMDETFHASLFISVISSLYILSHSWTGIWLFLFPCNMLYSPVSTFPGSQFNFPIPCSLSTVFAPNSSVEHTKQLTILILNVFLISLCINIILMLNMFLVVLFLRWLFHFSITCYYMIKLRETCCLFKYFYVYCNGHCSIANNESLSSF